MFSKVTPSHALVEFDKLDDIASSWDTARVAKAAIVSIEFFHCAEIGIAHSNDDDRAWHLRQFADEVNSLRHIMDSSIGQEQQNLVASSLAHRLHVIFELSQEWSKKGWTSKADLGESRPIRLHNVLDSNDLGVLRVAIHRETVVGRVQVEVAWDASEAENWEATV